MARGARRARARRSGNGRSPAVKTHARSWAREGRSRRARATRTRTSKQMHFLPRASAIWIPSFVPHILMAQYQIPRECTILWGAFPFRDRGRAARRAQRRIRTPGTASGDPGSFSGDGVLSRVCPVNTGSGPRRSWLWLGVGRCCGRARRTRARGGRGGRGWGRAGGREGGRGCHTRAEPRARRACRGPRGPERARACARGHGG